MRLAYKYRFYPTPEQAQILAQTFGCCRVVWNHMLSFRSEEYLKKKKSWSFYGLSRKLTELKQEEEFSYLRDVSCVTLQQSLRNQQVAFRNFFEKRSRYPKFKSRKGNQSVQYTKIGFRWDGQNIILAKMSKPLSIRWSRPIKGRITTVTVSKDPIGRYFVSFSLEAPDIKPLRKTKSEVGVDVGLTHFATLSNGEKITNPRFHQRDLAKLKRAQQDLSRKKKGSQNRDKARLRVARIHASISDRRSDFLHKLSTRLVRENQTIVVEDLNIRGMVRNHCLARGISDVGWGEFIRQLEYKSEWYGREFVRIDRWFPSSKRCSECGFTQDKLPLKIRRWICPECGKEHDRDHNAALNILAAGRAVTACGDIVRRQGASPRCKCL